MVSIGSNNILTCELFDAVERNDVYRVAQILNSDKFCGEELKERDYDDGRTVLFYAELPRITKMLIDAGADVFARDKDGKRPWEVIANPVAKKIVEVAKNLTIKKYVESLPLLSQAVYKNDIDKVSELISNGAKINESNTDGDTALILASKYNYGEIIKILLANGADVNCSNNSGITALHCVKTVEEAELMINYGANVICTDVHGNTPLHIAAYYNRVEIAELLIKNGAVVNIKDEIYETPLLTATMENSTKTITVLLKAGADPNLCGDYGNSPLCYAIRNNNFDVIKMLVDAGADINAKDKGGWFPIDYAVRTYTYNVSDEIVKFLIDNGANVKNRYKNGSTLLFDPMVGAETAKLLIDAGCDVNAKDNEGTTALHITDYVPLSKVLIEAGADINAVDNNGWTSIDRALLEENNEVVYLLLDFGAKFNPELQDNYGNKLKDKITDLLIGLVNAGDKATVEQLINAGADVNGGSDRGESALFDAVKNEDAEIVRLLVKAGADVNGAYEDRNESRDYNEDYDYEYDGDYDYDCGEESWRKDKKTPLYLAIEKRNLQITKFLIASGANLDLGKEYEDSDFRYYTNTPLQCAVELNDAKMTKLLIESGANINAVNSDGHTALDITKNEMISGILLNAGAQSSELSAETILLYNIFGNNNDNIAEILQNGVDISTLDNKAIQNTFKEWEKKFQWIKIDDQSKNWTSGDVKKIIIRVQEKINWMIQQEENWRTLEETMQEDSSSMRGSDWENIDIPF